MTINILKLEGNYLQMLYAFQLPTDFCAPQANHTSVIKKDILRSVFLSRRHEHIAFADNWQKSDTDESYTQGNITAAVFGGCKTTMLQQHFIDNNPDTIGDIYQQHKNFSVAFIDDKGRDCGLAFTYQNASPNYFTVSYLQNTRLNPEQRKVTCFQSSDDNLYPSLSELITPVNEENTLENAKQTLIPTSLLKHHLLNIDDLPHEIQFLIMDAIDEKGRLVPSAIESMRQSIVCGDNNNKGVKFKTDLALESIKHEKALCDLLITKLDESDLKKHHQDDTRQLRDNIKKILTRIETTLKNNATVLRFDAQSYIEQACIIHALLTRYKIEQQLDMFTSNNETFESVASPIELPKQNKAQINTDIDSLKKEPADTEINLDEVTITATKKTLVFYRTLCSSFLQELDKTKRAFPDHLNADIRATLYDINALTDQLTLTPNTAKNIDNKTQTIQTALHGYLSHKALNQPYHTLLNTMSSRYAHWAQLSSTPLTERIGHELFAASCFALLSIGLFVAASTGTLSTALAFSMLVPLSIGSAALLAYAGYQQWQYDTRDATLEINIKNDIKAFSKRGGSLDTFAYCLENPSLLTPEPSFKANEQRFFRQTSKACASELKALTSHSPS